MRRWLVLALCALLVPAASPAQGRDPIEAQVRPSDEPLDAPPILPDAELVRPELDLDGVRDFEPEGLEPGELLPPLELPEEAPAPHVAEIRRLLG